MLLLSVPIAYAFDALTLPQLFVVGFLVGIFTVFFDVAYQSYLPSLVERDQIIEGNSKLEVSRSVAQISGPGVAGGLIGLITAPYAVLVDAISFFASGVVLTESEAGNEARRSGGAASRGCAPSSGRGCSTSSGTRCCGPGDLYGHLELLLERDVSIFLVYASARSTSRLRRSGSSSRSAVSAAWSGRWCRSG